MDLLLRARAIYTAIAEQKDTLEALIYKEKEGQIATLIRSCSVNLGIDQGETIVYSEQATIRTQIDELLSQKKTEQA